MRKKYVVATFYDEAAAMRASFEIESQLAGKKIHAKIMTRQHDEDGNPISYSAEDNANGSVLGATGGILLGAGMVFAPVATPIAAAAPIVAMVLGSFAGGLIERKASPVLPQKIRNMYAKYIDEGMIVWMARVNEDGAQIVARRLKNLGGLHIFVE